MGGSCGRSGVFGGGGEAGSASSIVAIVAWRRAVHGARAMRGKWSKLGGEEEVEKRA